MIVYFISNYVGVNTGRGGHYYSLYQMAEEVSKTEDVLVISIGCEQPAIFSNVSYAVHVNATLLTIGFSIKRIVELISSRQNSKVRVVHGYDEYTLYPLRKISQHYACEMLLTKCGGPTKKNFPVVDRLIVFHSEDFKFYSGLKKIKSVYEIPGRVRPTNFNRERERQLAAIYDAEYVNIVKIGRIGKYYLSSLKQAVDLSEVVMKCKRVSLILIGHIESTYFLDELKSYATKKNVSLKVFSESEYTKNASELLWGADLVLGTGRGAMEALSAGKLLFFPVKGERLPCVFDRATAEYAMTNNFSERTRLPAGHECYLTESYIIDLLENEIEVLEKIEFGKNVFDKRYSLESGVKEVLKIYSIENNENRKSSFYYDFGILLRSYAAGLKSLVRPVLLPVLNRMRK